MKMLILVLALITVPAMAGNGIGNDYAFPKVMMRGGIQRGLTVRDYAAIHIMAGFAANGDDALVNRMLSRHATTVGIMARQAYKLADALLAARD